MLAAKHSWNVAIHAFVHSRSYPTLTARRKEGNRENEGREETRSNVLFSLCAFFAWCRTEPFSYGKSTFDGSGFDVDNKDRGDDGDQGEERASVDHCCCVFKRGRKREVSRWGL